MQKINSKFENLCRRYRVEVIVPKFNRAEFRLSGYEPPCFHLEWSDSDRPNIVALDFEKYFFCKKSFVKREKKRENKMVAE